MSCRFPGGVSSPEDMWDLLAEAAWTRSRGSRGTGTGISDGIYDPDPEHEGTSYVRGGGFVQTATDFDPGFFSISPREALAMDPQQRLLLETAWEVLERTGLDPGSLRGSRTGVFVGAAYGSYSDNLLTTLQGTGGLEGYLMTGTATSVLSGRVSAVARPGAGHGRDGGHGVLVGAGDAAHGRSGSAAGTGVRSGAGRGERDGDGHPRRPGQLLPARRKGLAADGRCKAFAAAADGMGLAEGIGLLVVERLADARRNGHPVLAVVAGSAINQDGASNGLTAPNGRSQQRVIRAALAAAGLSAADVDAVEAHGTGTTLGDPLEAQALWRPMGRDAIPTGRCGWGRSSRIWLIPRRRPVPPV